MHSLLAQAAVLPCLSITNLIAIARVLSTMNTTTIFIMFFGFLVAAQKELIMALIPITTSSVTMITHQFPIVYSFYIRPTVDSQLKEGGQVCN